MDTDPQFSFAPPDGVPCCDSSVHWPDYCTCWRSVLVPHPTEHVQQGPNAVRADRCGDCAYRRDSPERAELEGDDLPYTPEVPFFCHEGMPRAGYFIHPSGAVREAPDGAYEPIGGHGRAWMADGRPALVCAGWAAVDRRVQAARARRGEVP